MKGMKFKLNTERVFIGYSKDGNELLLYRKDINMYVDLLSRNNDVYPIENLNTSVIIPYRKEKGYGTCL